MFQRDVVKNEEVTTKRDNCPYCYVQVEEAVFSNGNNYHHKAKCNYYKIRKFYIIIINIIKSYNNKSLKIVITKHKL